MSFIREQASHGDAHRYKDLVEIAYIYIYIVTFVFLLCNLSPFGLPLTGIPRLSSLSKRKRPVNPQAIYRACQSIEDRPGPFNCLRRGATRGVWHGVTQTVSNR